MFGKPSRRATIGRRRLTLVIAVVAAVCVLAFLFFTGRIPALPMSGVGAHSVNGMLPENTIGTPAGLLYTEGSVVHLLRESGQPRWEVDTGLSDIEACVSDDLILIYSGANVQTMQYSREQLFSTSVDSEILAGAAGEHYVAVLIDAPADNAGTQQMIYLFEQSGQKTAQLSFNRQVLDFGFFSDDTIDDLFWVLSLDTAGTAPMSYITMYNKANGEMTYSITLSAKVIERVIVTSNLIYANGSGTLTALTYFGEAQAVEPIAGWKIGSYVSNATSLDIAYVPRTTAASIETVQTFTGDGSSGVASFTGAKFGLPMGIIDVAVTPSSLYAFTNDAMYVYSIDGTLERTQSLGMNVMHVKQVSDDYVVMWGEQDTYILQLQ